MLSRLWIGQEVIDVGFGADEAEPEMPNRLYTAGRRLAQAKCKLILLRETGLSMLWLGCVPAVMVWFRLPRQ